MTEQQQPTTPSTDQEIDSKEQGSKALTNERANKQIEKRPRYPPRAPGLLPPTLDNVITMILQFIITLISLLAIISSASVASDRDDVYWIIFLEIIFTYSGFALFTHYIKRCIVIYNKFYKKIGEWQYQRLESISNNNSSCPGLWCLLVRLVYWTYTILIFPVVIVWSMWQSYRFYQDRRKNAHSEDGHTQKTDKRVYSIWSLGILSKQASMITLFIQDFPLMIICAIIGNWTFFVIYLVAIVQKLIFWMKYIYDLSECRMFYDEGDYGKHFGMKLILIEYSEILKCYDVTAIPYSKREMELLTLQEGDWIRIWVGNEKYIQDVTELNDVNCKVMRVYKNKHLKEIDNLVCVDIDGVSIEKLDDYFEGRTKKLDVSDENFHTINRWYADYHLELLSDEMYEKYRGNSKNNGDDCDEKEDDRTNFIESDGNKNGAELDTEVKSNENGTEVTNGGDGRNGLEEARVIDMPETQDGDDGYGAKNGFNGDENEENDEKDGDRTNVIESDINKNGDELNSEIKSNENETEVTNGGDGGDDLNEATAIDMPEKEDKDDGMTMDNVNNNEENVVADSYTANSNKATEVENEENEEIVNNPQSIQSEDIENNETDKLNDSPVVIDEEHVSQEENDYGHGGGGDEYVQIPLTSNDEIDENES